MLSIINMSEILVSVIIPIYNGEKYISKCLEQISKQTFKNFEVVFIDDASKDNSYTMIHEFMKDNEDILFNYIKLDENKGISNAKNTGLWNSKGKYVLFHDQDDWMEDNCLELLINAAIENNADKVTGAYREVDIDGNILRNVEYGDNFSKWFCTALHAVLFRKAIFIQNDIRIPIDTLMEDGYVNANFAVYAEKCIYLNSVIFNYLVRLDSTSGAKNNSKKWNAITLFQSALDCYYSLYNTMGDEKDKISVEYMAIKQYYFYLLHNNRYSSFKDIRSQYICLKGMLKRHFPDYIDNKYIHYGIFRDGNGDRKSGQRLMLILNIVERLRLMKLFLRMYLFLSKFKYFYQ